MLAKIRRSLSRIPLENHLATARKLHHDFGLSLPQGVLGELWQVASIERRKIAQQLLPRIDAGSGGQAPAHHAAEGECANARENRKLSARQPDRLRASAGLAGFSGSGGLNWADPPLNPLLERFNITRFRRDFSASHPVGDLALGAHAGHSDNTIVG